MVRSNLQRVMAKIAPDLDPKTVWDFFSQMEEDYFSLYTPEEICTHIRMSHALDSLHPVQLKVTPRGKGRFDIIIVAFDYFSEFSIICGLLASFGFDIQTGNIYTFSRTIVDVFHVSLHAGEVFNISRQKEFEKELQILIRLLGEGLFQEVRERLNRRLVEHLEKGRGLLAGPLYPIEVRFDNRISSKWTVMDVHSKDTPAFLYAFSNALSMRGVYIHKVMIQSVGTEIQDRFYISDRESKKIKGEMEQNAVKIAVVLIKQFTHFLTGAPDPAKAIRYFDQLLDRITKEKVPAHTISFFKEEEGLNVLAQLLGASDFLWEDFLRMQFEDLLPILEDVKKRELHPGPDVIRRKLAKHLAQGTTYELKKRILNEFKDREMFFIDMKHLLEPQVTLMDFSRALTDLTEVVLDQAYVTCNRHWVERYGRPLQEDGTGCPFSICGLGKFGGREMGYASDIELLFVYGGTGQTRGKRSIENGEFFERLARELVDFIEARQEGIFHIDLRLRPYGKAGPWATSIEPLKAYYSLQGEAAPFERQALIKLRWVAGDESLGREVEAHRDRFVYSGEPWDLKTALHLRRRQVRELVKPGRVNVKYSPGGIIDIEYAAQYLQIMHGKDHPELRTPTTVEALDRLGRWRIISHEERAHLREAYIFLRTLIDGLRMVRGNARDLVLPERASEEFQFLARRLGYREQGWEEGARKLTEDIRYHMMNVDQFFERRF